METSGTIVISATAVKGHWELLAGGHENCPVVATECPVVATGPAGSSRSRLLPP